MDKAIRNSLYETARRLNSVRFDYALIGSANLALQGIQIKPGDIDVFVDVKHFPELEEAFAEYEFLPMPPIENEDKIYIKKKILLDAVEVEFGTEPRDGWYTKHLKNWTVTPIEFEDIVVKCLPLEKELLVYKELGKSDKVNLITAFLSDT